MKKIFTILFLLPLFVMAQKQEYTTHTVGPKESLTSIGRMYNINGRELAKLNNIDYDKGLSLGQVLKVPKNSKTTATVSTPVVTAPVVKTEPVKPVAKANGTGAPIYHVVAPKETLYGISVKYGKVPIADLKKWNNLTTDGLKEGSKLIVGYSKSSTDVVKETPVVVKETPPVVKETPVVVKETPVVKAKEKDPEPIKEIKKEEPVVEESVVSTPPSGKNFNGGIFKSTYTSQAKKGDVVDESGLAGVFKSSSGWEDGKYYCLHNSAPSGTVLKITNQSTGKTIYAKVLDMVIPDIKQNNGLLIRLSNAAAEELGVNGDKFDCKITYSN
jgi:LysM repeat protein